MGPKLVFIGSLVVVWVAANTGATPASRALPWLHNLASSAETSEATPSVIARMSRWRAADPSCSAAAYGGLAITAEVAANPGLETVLASLSQGVLVLDARAAVIAAATPLPCEGSADEVDGLAAGDAHIDGPVIALAVTTGGHRESVTRLVLYRVADGVVAPIFTGIVSVQTGDQTRTGEVTLLPGALLYRAPSGTRALWSYDAAQHRYVPQGTRPPDA
jgi:cobalamin biosynthesis protein CobD/CbiB